MFDASIWIISPIIFFSIVLGIIAFLEKPKEKINRTFLMMILSIVVWQISNFMENEDIGLNLQTIFLRIDFASAILVGYFWFLFVLNFSQSIKIKIKPLYKKTIFLAAILVSLLSLTNLVILNIGLNDGSIKFDYGNLWFVYAIGVLGFFIAGYVIIIINLLKSRGSDRTQSLFILLGFSISSIIALVVNLFLSDYLTGYQSRIGLYGIIIFVICTFYAIIKHNLFNIKVIAVQLFTFALCATLLIKAFLSVSAQDLIINLIIFISVSIFGVLLIRYVVKEVEQAKEIKKAYEIEKQAHQDLIELDEAKTNFMLVTQHHLRTPLSVTAGFMDLLIRGNYGKIDNNALEIIKRSDESIRKEIEVVNDLLTVSSFQLGKGYVQFEQNVPIKDILADIVNDLKPVADTQKIYLKFESAENIPNISADKKQIRMALQNIIDNAIKYTKQGGVDVKIKLEGDKVKIEIKDSGMGMTPEDQKELFKAFHRNKESWAANATGKGIGLFLTDQIIHAHSGKIWAESEGPGKGTTFNVELPINADLQSINKPLQVKSVNTNI